MKMNVLHAGTGDIETFEPELSVENSTATVRLPVGVLLRNGDVIELEISEDEAANLGWLS